MLAGTYSISQKKVVLPSIWLRNHPGAETVDIFIDGENLIIKEHKPETKVESTNEIEETA